MDQPFSTADCRSFGRRWLLALVAALPLTNVAVAVPPRSETAVVRQADAVAPKILRYAKSLVRRYDKSGDGQLDEGEWRSMRGQPRRIDADGNGAITVEELARHVARYGQRNTFRGVYGGANTVANVNDPAVHPPTASEPSASPASPSTPDQRGTRFALSPDSRPKGLPDWFSQRDADGDGQLTLREYSPGSAAAQVAQFARWDQNRDGLVTAEEYLRAAEKQSSAAPVKTGG